MFIAISIGHNTFFHRFNMKNEANPGLEMLKSLPKKEHCVSVLPIILLYRVQTIICQSSQSSQGSVVVTSF